MSWKKYLFVSMSAILSAGLLFGCAAEEEPSEEEPTEENGDTGEENGES
ncbi:hypothetical protein [Pseudalkalibacillus salsuginis]|nr:hypothetical protein [Pseudalkalibacillus salsuginis]MCF6410907.1 hypothetical protein [Pseudalkalibacillus salsuginis]